LGFTPSREKKFSCRLRRISSSMIGLGFDSFQLIKKAREKKMLGKTLPSRPPM